MKRVSLLGSAAIFALVFSACGGGGEHQHGEEMMAAVPAPDAEGAAGFDEFPIGEDRDVGPLHV